MPIGISGNIDFRVKETIARLIELASNEMFEPLIS